MYVDMKLHSCLCQEDETEKGGLYWRRPVANQVTNSVAIVTHSSQVTLLFKTHPRVQFQDWQTLSFLLDPLFEIIIFFFLAA